MLFIHCHLIPLLGILRFWRVEGAGVVSDVLGSGEDSESESIEEVSRRNPTNHRP